MDDRIAEIREALALVGGPAGESWAGEFFLVHQAIIEAAREYADLRESDALIIRRDENGEWPERFIRFIMEMGYNHYEAGMILSDLDALASSQGVERPAGDDEVLDLTHPQDV